MKGKVSKEESFIENYSGLWYLYKLSKKVKRKEQSEPKQVVHCARFSVSFFFIMLILIWRYTTYNDTVAYSAHELFAGKLTRSVEGINTLDQFLDYLEENQ